MMEFTLGLPGVIPAFIYNRELSRNNWIIRPPVEIKSTKASAAAFIRSSARSVCVGVRPMVVRQVIASSDSASVSEAAATGSFVISQFAGVGETSCSTGVGSASAWLISSTSSSRLRSP
jgi:hypothetical protein